MDGLLGTHFIYTYDNSREYEWYAKNDHTVDYRIHSGIVAGRWVKDQETNVVMLTESIYKAAWAEPTGADTTLNSVLNEKKLSDTIFFLAWVHEHPKITVCFQNERIDLMGESHEKYATYPKLVVPEFVHITYMGGAGQDSEDVIPEAPYEGLPDDVRNGKYFNDNYKRLKK